jgi:hypothetical protein
VHHSTTHWPSAKNKLHLFFNLNNFKSDFCHLLITKQAFVHSRNHPLPASIHVKIILSKPLNIWPSQMNNFMVIPTSSLILIYKTPKVDNQTSTPSHKQIVYGNCYELCTHQCHFQAKHSVKAHFNFIQSC